MLPDHNPILQAFLGTLLTWGMTAVGAGLVIFFYRTKMELQRKLLDGGLGFAAGVMLAASFFSLLAPAIEEAKGSGTYGNFAFVPVAVGFLLGAIFVEMADWLISRTGAATPEVALATMAYENEHTRRNEESTVQGGAFDLESNQSEVEKNRKKEQWKRILLLIVAITAHNIPEGIAVGVGFAAIGSTPSATFENAISLAIGMGIQNLPEGLAVSLPLRAAGFSTFKSFWYGQLSGMVEPIGGVLGAAVVQYITPILPYALAFAASAMIYVIFDDILPEAQTSGNGKLATWTATFGFIVMMVLEVGLG